MTTPHRWTDDQLDDLIKHALTAPVRDAVPNTHRRPLWLGLSALAAAAALALAILPSLLATPTRPVPTIDPTPTLPGVRADAQPDRQPRDVPASLVVLARLTITKPLATRMPAPDGVPADTAVREPVPVSDALARALRHGDVSEAITLIEATDQSDQLESTSALGEAIRSADTARAVLDGLDPDDQLRVVRVWVRSPHLRPVAFDRLAQLAQQPELHDRVIALADELRDEPDLNAWMASTHLSLSTP